MTATVVALTVARVSVRAWTPPPPAGIGASRAPFRPPPPAPVPPPPERFAGGRLSREAYARHLLRAQVWRIRGRHPRLDADAAMVEALARQRWRELNPGTCVANGLTLAEHLRAQRQRAEQAAKRRRPEERNLRATVRAAVQRHDAARGQSWQSWGRAPGPGVTRR